MYRHIFLKKLSFFHFGVLCSLWKMIFWMEFIGKSGTMMVTFQTLLLVEKRKMERKVFSMRFNFLKIFNLRHLFDFPSGACPIPLKERLIMYSNRMLGVPRLRMLRVNNQSCNIPEDFEDAIKVSILQKCKQTATE